MMSEEYPLYPKLLEGGAEEAQALIDKFKGELKSAADEVIGRLYCDVAPNIESDSWTNYRNQMMNGFRNYSNRSIQGDYDFKAIRQEIYKEFRDEIIIDLNQDLVKENEDLKEQLMFLRETTRGNY